MERSLTILVKIDNIAADMYGPVLHRYNQDYADSLHPWALRKYALHECVKPECGAQVYNYLADGIADMPEMPGARAALQQWVQDGHDLYLLAAPSTERDYDPLIPARIAWAAKHLPFIPRDHVVVAPPHMLWADVLIHDSPDVARRYRQDWGLAPLIATIGYAYTAAAPDLWDLCASTRTQAKRAWALLAEEVARFANAPPRPRALPDGGEVWQPRKPAAEPETAIMVLPAKPMAPPLPGDLGAMVNVEPEPCRTSFLEKEAWELRDEMADDGSMYHVQGELAELRRSLHEVSRDADMNVGTKALITAKVVKQVQALVEAQFKMAQTQREMVSRSYLNILGRETQQTIMDALDDIEKWLAGAEATIFNDLARLVTTVPSEVLAERLAPWANEKRLEVRASIECWIRDWRNETADRMDRVAIGATRVIAKARKAQRS